MIPESVISQPQNEEAHLASEPASSVQASTEIPRPETVTAYDNPLMRAMARLIYAEACRYDFR